MKRIVIVIPIYKDDLNVFELISVTQAFRTLDSNDICFVVPKSLSAETITKQSFTRLSSYKVERFSDDFFRSTLDYSRLCLSTEFYERFLDYEYMLIYQTDAFVFEDRLNDFIDMGYDYYGAAVVSEFWKEFHVGNGGLSLRHIKNTLSVVKDIDIILQNVDGRNIVTLSFVNAK